VRILAVSPVMREMILHARRWPIGRSARDQIGDRFFATLGDLVEGSLDQELPLRVPTSQHPIVAAAMRYTIANITHVTIADVSAAVGASERSLRRIFARESGMSWRQYLLESRLLRAIALLAEPGPNELAVATAVGFGSMSGFARAFRRYTGETPLAYRRRVMPGPAGG
jgi:AraC-like DNA-binding protein